MTLEEIQADMVGMSDADLLALAPTATHQHFKGGLYEFIGPVMDADTGLVLTKENPDSLALESFVGYFHVYPYPRMLWVRRASEFYGSKGDKSRFRPLIKS